MLLATVEPAINITCIENELTVWVLFVKKPKGTKCIVSLPIGESIVVLNSAQDCVARFKIPLNDFLYVPASIIAEMNATVP